MWEFNLHLFTSAAWYVEPFAAPPPVASRCGHHRALGRTFLRLGSTLLVLPLVPLAALRHHAGAVGGGWGDHCRRHGRRRRDCGRGHGLPYCRRWISLCLRTGSQLIYMVVVSFDCEL